MPFSTRLVPKIVQQCIFPEVARRLHLARTEGVLIKVDLPSLAMLKSTVSTSSSCRFRPGRGNGKQLTDNMRVSSSLGV